MSKPYFVIGCGRSGTTAVCSILDTAKNGICNNEPFPNLARESRKMMEGRLTDPSELVESTIVARVRKNEKEGMIYGEKNITFAPFVRTLHELLDCRFVFVKRDGRDVVRSLINWHEQKFANIYREAVDPVRLSAEARRYIGGLPIDLDDSDYARPRPLAGSPLHDTWLNLTRFEMCSYYWATINGVFLDELNMLPHGSWITVDVDGADSETFTQAAEFLGLNNLDNYSVNKMLNQKINSLSDRGSSPGTFSLWRDWDAWHHDRFNTIAGPMMRKLGYSPHLLECVQA